MSSKVIFITGGSRSGKSSFALQLARGFNTTVLFVATAEAKDEEMAERIANHKKGRPKNWRTLEASMNVGMRIEKEAGDTGVIVIDCLTLLVSNLLVCQAEAEPDARRSSVDVNRELNRLLRCFDRLEATFIIVSNEVGLGLVPPYPLGRVYRDLLGEVNQAIASRADEVYFMVSGIPLRLKQNPES